jgi:hypothetical protein
MVIFFLFVGMRVGKFLIVWGEHCQLGNRLKGLWIFLKYYLWVFTIYIYVNTVSGISFRSCKSWTCILKA